ncbi:MAG: type-F conjugative transfer system protein TraW [Alphaproteobacteria bacterium 41-28]|nr:MAG: type-F conjugative transfer system protein TraW [Alphaproteobacteria bacterium 41-28]
MFCISIILFSGVCLQADDFGTHGVIYPIEEEDTIVLIQQQLRNMEESGELARHNTALQKKTKAAIERPKPVEGITKASKERIFYFNPSYVVKEDLKDHQGRIVAKKGTKINPFETVSLSQNLLFFDGEDSEQREYAQQKLKDEKVKLILVKGAPLALSEEWSVSVYFDQGGLLTKKLGIRHVPALVSQEKLQLRIEEINLGEQE